MENKAQRKVILIIFAILICIAIIAIIWSLFISNEENSVNVKPEQPEPIPGDMQNFNTDISYLDNYNEFFTVSRIINDYYLEIVSQNTENVLNLLDEDYKREMGIQANNVFNIVKSNYTSVSYMPMKIYYNADSVVTYYFVNGYAEDVNFTENKSLYYNSVNFLIILNKNTKHYSVIPLDDDLDIEKYAENYELVEKKLEYNTYTEVETTEEMVLISYLNVFRDLLFLDNERAYQMLSKETKLLYNGIQNFYEHQQEIYDYIPSNIIGYAKEDNELVSYHILDSQQKKITIYEYHIMDFQISY